MPTKRRDIKPRTEGQVIDLAVRRNQREAAQRLLDAARADPDRLLPDAIAVMFRGDEVVLTEPDVQELLVLAFAAVAIPGSTTLADLRRCVAGITGVSVRSGNE